MEFELQQTGNQQQELDSLNKKLKQRAEKFNSTYKQLTLEDLKILKLQKAKETGDQKYLNNLFFQEVTDLEQRQKIIKQRTQKFYNTIKVEDAQKFFEAKTIPDFSDQNIIPRDNVIHLYGVDYMSNQMIRNYFGQNYRFRIQWLNDSSCNIVFDSKMKAQQMIGQFKRGEQSMKEQQQQIWHELKPYIVEEKQRRLFCRIATNKDVKNSTTTGKNSKYYQYINSKLHLKKMVQYKARQKIFRQKKVHRDEVKRHKIIKKQARKKQEEQSISSSSSSAQSSEEQQQNK